MLRSRQGHDTRNDLIVSLFVGRNPRGFDFLSNKTAIRWMGYELQGGCVIKPAFEIPSGVVNGGSGDGPILLTPASYPARES